MKLWPGSRNQAGDTIVEVLIALAVISSVIVGAFFVVQKSTTAVRDSQEHGEVQQLLQGQIELVRSLALTADKTAPIFDTTPAYFCIDNSNPASPTRQNFGASFTLPADANSDDYSGYPAACKNIQTYYNIAITYKDNTFYATGRWDRLNGGKDQETMAYRIYPNQKLVSVGAVASPGKPDANGLVGGNNTNNGNGSGNGGGPKNCVKGNLSNWTDPKCWRVTYQYTAALTVPIAKCIWDFGDLGDPNGSRITYDGSDEHCQATGKVYTYQYVYRTVPTNTVKFNITLTVIAANGQTATKDFPPLTRPLGF